MIIVYSVVVALLTMPFRMLIQVFAKDVYGSMPSEVGMLMTAVAIGGIGGSIIVANLRKGNQRGMLLILGAARRASEGESIVRKSEWDGWRAPARRARNCSNAT